MAKNYANRDAFERINYLYQVAHTTLRENPTNTQLIQYYVKTLRYIAQKQVLRLEPEMKRTICKKCNILLVPGITSRVRMKKKREKHTVVTCLHCNSVRRYFWRQGHQLWTERPECWLDSGQTTPTMSYGDNNKLVSGEIALTTTNSSENASTKLCEATVTSKEFIEKSTVMIKSNESKHKNSKHGVIT